MTTFTLRDGQVGEVRASALSSFEVLHKGDERVHTCFRHGVVDAGAHAAHGTVPLEGDEPLLLRLFEERAVEIRLRRMPWEWTIFA